MNSTQIDLSRFLTHGGILAEYNNHVLELSAKTQNTRFHTTVQPIHSYIEIPGRFALPLRIDLTVNIRIPGLYLVLGEGHVSFGTRQDNRSIGDLFEHDSGKPKHFYDHVALNKDIGITLVYGLGFMQIIIDNEVRYFSKKEKYIKLPAFKEANQNGFDLKIGVDKQASTVIKELIVTEYDEEPEPVGFENIPSTIFVDKSEKHSFEDCISRLSPELQGIVGDMNDFLLGMKNLKIKRSIEGSSLACKITYTSAFGFSYAVLISENVLSHFFWWYMVSNYKYEGKFMGRKNDYTRETLVNTDVKSPETAERLFSYYDECYHCGEFCSARTTYEFKDRKKLTCHGKMMMNMSPQTFKDVTFMFGILQEILAK